MDEWLMTLLDDIKTTNNVLQSGDGVVRGEEPDVTTFAARVDLAQVNVDRRADGIERVVDPFVGAQRAGSLLTNSQGSNS